MSKQRPKPKAKKAPHRADAAGEQEVAGRSRLVLLAGIVGGGMALVGVLTLIIVAGVIVLTRKNPEPLAQNPPVPQAKEDGGVKPPPVENPPAPVVKQPQFELPRIPLPSLPPVQALPAANPTTEKPFLVTDPGGHTARVTNAFFAPADDVVLTISADKSVRVWDVGTGDLVHTFRLPIGPAAEGALYAGAISPDGRYLAVGGLPVGAGKHGILTYLISLETYQVERVLQGHRNSINGLAFTHNGRYLASCSNDGTAILYDHQDGAVVRVFQGHSNKINKMAFAQDDKLLATTSRDGTCRVWSVAEGKTVVHLQNFTAEPLSVAFNPVLPGFATGCVDGTIQLWQLDGTRTAHFNIEPAVKRQPVAIQYSPDGRELLYGGVSFGGDVGLIDLATQRQRLYFNKHSNTVVDARFSHDGKLAVTTGGERNETIIWRVKDGAIVQKLQGTGQAVWAVGWRLDGKAFGWGNTNRAAKSPLEHSFVWEDLHFGPAPENFGRIMSSANGWAIQQPDFFKVNFVRQGQVVHSFTAPIDGNRIYSWSLLPGNRAVIGASFGMYLVDITTNQILRSYRGHNGLVLSVSPSPDGRHFLTGSSDMTLCLWDPEIEQPLVSFFAAEREWVAWTPQGYYAASPYGERLMGWQINNGIDKMASFHPAARFHASLYQPDLIRYLFQEKNLNKAVELAKKSGGQNLGDHTLAQVLPPAVVITAPGKTTVKQALLDVSAKATSTGNHPVTGLRLLVDGRPYRGNVSLRKVDAPKLGEVEGKWTIDLLPGKHNLAVIAESAVSKGMSQIVEVTRAGAAKDDLPNLYVLAAGISEYAGRLKLNYAHKDAIVLEKTLRERTAGVFKNVETRLLTDHSANRKQILEGMDWLQKKMTAKDVCVLFFAGHGSRDPKGRFHFIPVDCDLVRMDQTCISGDLLKTRLAALPGRVVVMLDACHSGAAAGAAQSKTALADDLMRDLVSEDYGVVVMCSSQGREYSMESAAVQHGYFTLSLVEGLTGKADYNQDKYVYIHEMDFFANQRVRQLSGGLQNPTTGRPPHIRSFPLASVP